MLKLSDEFLAPYKKKNPPFGAIGMVVFYRTYSRFLENEGRRERWWEVVKRVAEYSVSLVDPKYIYPREAEDLYDAIFNMRLFPAGRTLWVGGTDVVKHDGVANFNCAFKTIDSIEAFSESLYLLMNGCGVGFSVEQRYVDRLPRFHTDIEVIHYPYDFIPPHDFGNRDTSQTRCYPSVDQATIYVGDSKEGWRDALEYFLSLHVSKVSATIAIDYDYIRPEGSPLKTFGGRASGHQPLKEALQRIETIIKRCNGRLTPVDAMDIETIIAKVVVVGGVRRSSLIALGDSYDAKFIDAKYELFSDPGKAEFRDNRVMSNNSLMLYENPGKSRFEEILEVVVDNGEPGFINAAAAKLRRPDFQGLNPCAEILLRDRGLCNLAEIVVANHVNHSGVQHHLLHQSAILASRHCSRITEVEIRHSEWNRTQKEDRLLGVSLTGVMTAANRCPDINLGELFQEVHGIIRDAADRYHEERGVPRAKLATCIKPSGTLSLLPGVSPGIHQDYAPYYYRRIRVAKKDPVAKSLTTLGFKSMPENGQGKDYFDNLYATINYKLDQGKDVSHERRMIAQGFEALDAIGIKDIPQDPADKAYLQWDICKTKVFTFVVATDAKRATTEESAIEQLERYKLSMQHYTEHNTSVTVTFHKHEIPEIASWLDSNWDYYVGVSLLPAFAPYNQMPYEACTEDQYYQWKEDNAAIEEEDLADLIASFETGEEWDVDSDCAGGCPVR